MIWIRADANRDIGTGHMMRCLSIAAGLERLGERTCFLVADENAVPLLREREQEYRILHSDYRMPEGELGCLEAFLRGRKGDLFLADSYYMSAEYFRRVREWMPVGYMDDTGQSGFPLDILINYNIFANAALYGQPCGTKLLLGMEYAPLREEFAGVRYQIRENASGVLVTTGGSDRYNLAGRLLEKALADKRVARLEYRVVSGVYNAHLDALKALERKHANVRICSNVSDMARLMRESDIAVTAGGSTMYELSAVGVPTVCFSFADNQERVVDGFLREGLVCFGGNYLAQGDTMLDEVADAIALLASDVDLRKSYSARMRRVADGQGAARIARELLRLQ